MSKRIKLCLVSSRGGHLYQLYQLRNWWRKYKRFWITGRGGDVDCLLKEETVYYGFFPESRNGINAIRNFFLGLWVLYREKPDIVASCGAGIAPPIFLAAKLLGARLLFIDSVSFVRYPSLSAKLASLFGATVVVQHKRITKALRGAKYWGSIL